MNPEDLDKEIKNLGLGNIPILDMDDPDFSQKLGFAIWSTDSSSDYRNDRERPYNGQPHTDDGERGKQLVHGLTMRDLRDCMVMAMLQAAPSDKYIDEDFMKCWDFSTNPPAPTKYMLDRQDDPDFISKKVELGTWRTQDIHKINWNEIDPMAICQNFTCQVEKMMGIFPNTHPLRDELEPAPVPVAKG